MRNNLPVTDRENDYPESYRIVSTTSAKGVISYVNEDFIEVSGFKEDELLGEAHNLVRHPDMPQAAFKELWDTIKTGRAWMGMVKNRCKNGDAYWVDAFVTPIFTQGEISGYQSVRRKPSKALIEGAKRTYANSSKGFLSRIGLRWQLVLAFQLLALPLLLLIDTTATQAMALIAEILISAGLAYVIARPFEQLAEQGRELFDSKTACKVYAGGTSESAQLKTLLHFLDSEKETILWRMQGVAGDVSNSASDASRATQATSGEMHTLSMEVEQVATSMHEMSATVQEVARNASLTASTTESANDSAYLAKENAIASKDRIHTLAKQVECAVESISQLAKDSEKIGAVIDVINAIAEQTNLLALNAAIEAARAGEQGRGFSVVADEVRSLAGKTQASTGEVQQVVSTLQNAAAEAVKTMEACKQEVTQSVSDIENVESSIETIVVSVQEISGMSMQIATATEEQSSVSEEINRNINNISQAGSTTLDTSNHANNASGKLTEAVEYMRGVINQFQK